MSFDFATILDATDRQNAGIVVTIKDLNGDPTDWKITVAGLDSKKAREARNRASDQRVAAHRFDPLTAAESEELSAQILAACIIGWVGAEMNGQPFAYSPENAIVVAQNPYVGGQIAAAAGDRALFIKS
jgi:hypothetical protein